MVLRIVQQISKVGHHELEVGLVQQAQSWISQAQDLLELAQQIQIRISQIRDLLGYTKNTKSDLLLFFRLVDY